MRKLVLMLSAFLLVFALASVSFAAEPPYVFVVPDKNLNIKLANGQPYALPAGEIIRAALAKEYGAAAKIVSVAPAQKGANVFIIDPRTLEVWSKDFLVSKGIVLVTVNGTYVRGETGQIQGGTNPSNAREVIEMAAKNLAFNMKTDAYLKCQ